MRPVYVITDEGKICKITEICTCEKCRERGEVEFRLETLEGEFIDYIKFHELKFYIKNISYDISKLTYKNDLYEVIAMMLHLELLES